ncbi:MAG: IS200/IS605 family element transposase accessory protein TnpB [Erysipelotrichaceae bacterium]|nr:IS200/IS605 family element transposase accessory protein TnpB [Erysipelotrichaceae bacterium]
MNNTVKITKGFKYRIYPTESQKQMMEQTFGNVRFVYNHFLNMRSEEWKNDHKSICYNKTSSLLTDLKKEEECSWLNLSDSMALQESLRDLDRAFQNFFKKNNDYPVFHSKHEKQSYRTRNQNNSIRIEGNRLILPKIGKVKIKLSRDIKGRILNATISRTKTGKYYVSLCCEYKEDIKINNGGAIGIDVGLKEFYTDSNGTVVDNPKYLANYDKKLLKEQKKLSRMIEMNIDHYTSNRVPVYKKPLSECKNIQKQRVKLARIHEKISDCRSDLLHKASTTLVKENQIIAVEDLNVKGMIRNHKLARSINDVSWSEFHRLLECKAKEYDSVFIKVPRFYASSQTCHVCGYKNALVKDLRIRKWTCPVCGSHHDRDHNAAINILNEALKMLDSV